MSDFDRAITMLGKGDLCWNLKISLLYVFAVVDGRGLNGRKKERPDST